MSQDFTIRQFINRTSHTPGLVYGLCLHEVSAQRRETLFGLTWMIAWPFIQAGGFLLAFNLIRGASFDGQTLITTYFGVLVWSSTTLAFTSGLLLLKTNIDLIRYLAFPFHLIVVTDITVKYVFFFIQFIIAAIVFFLFVGVPDIPRSIAALCIIALSLLILFVALGWFASLLGAVVPDISVALPPILMLLMALSPIFHRDLSAAPTFVQIINDFNPLAQLIVVLYSSVGVYGDEIHLPYPLLAISVTALILMMLVVKRLYKEIAKVI